MNARPTTAAVPETDIMDAAFEIECLAMMLRREAVAPDHEERFRCVLNATLARIEALTEDIAGELFRQEEEEADAERPAPQKTKRGAK